VVQDQDNEGNDLVIMDHLLGMVRNCFGVLRTEPGLVPFLCRTPGTPHPTPTHILGSAVDHDTLIVITSAATIVRDSSGVWRGEGSRRGK
jgi:hypothetical protein